MNIANNGMLLKGANFNLRPKLYFDSALPENAVQQVREETAVCPSNADADFVVKTSRRCCFSAARSR